MTAALAKQLARTEEHEGDLAEIWRGLQASPKRLPCKLFYDAHGSRLFERICKLPEYYPTRAELEILRRSGMEMADLIGPNTSLIEFGSGASRKTRVLLDALDAPRVYVPIDISSSMLSASARALSRSYPSLDVRPLAADYTRELTLPLSNAEREAGVTVFFPGSTIGNFERVGALEFLARVRSSCGPQQRVLVGVDLPKERHVLESAYADRAGVTAQFNYNILRVLNRDYGGHFRLEDFSHRAVWNESASRVEMHLVSRCSQSVRMGAGLLTLHAGEALVTEHCYKYGLDAFRSLAEDAGFEVAGVWLDCRRLFSVQMLTPA